MAADYTELQQEIQNWLDNTNPNLVASIPELISSAEDWLDQHVEHWKREQQQTEAVAAGDIYSVPADYHTMLTVTRNVSTLTWTYRASIPRLATAPGGTNWLLAESSALYRMASLVESEGWLKNDSRIEIWRAQRDGLLAALNASGAGVVPTPVKSSRRGIRPLPTVDIAQFERLQYVTPTELLDIVGSGLTKADNGGRQVWSIVNNKIQLAPNA